jgi:hypothetical protein
MVGVEAEGGRDHSGPPVSVVLDQRLFLSQYPKDKRHPCRIVHATSSGSVSVTASSVREKLSRKVIALED